MKRFSFDDITTRTGTYSAKWDQHSSLIPLSVADMDIPAPEALIQRLNDFNQKGIYGYTDLSQNWNETVKNWCQRQYQWEIEADWVVFCPRVIQAVSLYLQNFTQPGDRIVTFSPAYHPINNAVIVNQRSLVESELRYDAGKYEIDFADLEEKLVGAKCFILLSPHNPTGIVWSAPILEKLCSLLEKHQVFIISDDVHADFVFNNRHHHVISKVSQYTNNNSLICTSPGKTFNLAGLEIANIIIANPLIRERFKLILEAAGIHNPGYFSVPALDTAYQHCDDWVRALKEYIAANKAYTRDFLLHHFPQLTISDTDGTYLLWVDYRGLGITEPEVRHWFNQLAGVDVSWGSGFGPAGEGFFRINVAAPRQILEQALIKIAATYSSEHF